MRLCLWNKVRASTLLCLPATHVPRTASNGALHSVINAAGFWKAFWKSEAVGAEEAEGSCEGMWQHALLQLRSVQGLHDASPCTTAHDARVALQCASLSTSSTSSPSPQDCDVCFMRLSQRRSFKVDSSLLEWICFSRTPQAVAITCVPVIPPPHVLDNSPPSSYLPMCDCI